MHVLEKWNQCIGEGNMDLLDEILDEDVVFHSPVVWKPQEGKKITQFYLRAADQVIGGDHFTYEKEIVDKTQACLEFTSKIGDTIINGVDIITWNNAGKITEFKVMVRPLQAVNAIWQAMQEMMEQMKKGK